MNHVMHQCCGVPNFTIHSLLNGSTVILSLCSLIPILPFPCKPAYVCIVSCPDPPESGRVSGILNKLSEVEYYSGNGLESLLNDFF